MADQAVKAARIWSPLLKLDPYTRIGLAIYVLVMIIRFALLTPSDQALFDTHLAELILLGTFLMLLGRKISRVSDTSEKLFYGILLAGFGTWFLASLFHFAVPGQTSTNMRLFRDVLFMLNAATIVVAIELRLDTYNTNSWLQRRSLHAIGGFLLVYAAFSYFAIVPVYVGLTDYATPYGLYATIDLFLALRFLTAATQTRSRSWRSTYSYFSVIFLLIFAADILAFAYRSAYLEYAAASPVNLIWYLWYPVAYVAIGMQRTRSVQVIQETDAQVLGSATGGLFLFGLVLPLIHVVGYGFDLFYTNLREARDVFVAVWIVLITLLYTGVYFFISRHIAKLDTERATAEEKATKLEYQLEREIRLRLLGRLSAGLAHDFGNSLFAISSHAKAIENRLKAGESHVPDITGLRQAIKYAQELVTKLSLVGAESTNAIVEMFDIRVEVDKTIQVITPSLGGEVVLKYLPKAEPIMITAERSMIQQIVTNYVFNAADAIKRSGQIDVSIEAYPVRTHCASCGDLIKGEYAVLTVEDDGPGIDTTVRDNIFEPLITTKPLGKGSGLGLAMINAIMHRIEGHVGLRSTPNKGTSFIAYFPL